MVKKQYEKLKGLAKDHESLEAYKILQQRIDLYFKDNNEDIRRADAEANNVQRALSGHLITFASLLITVSAFIVQNNFSKTLNGWQKGFFVIAIFFLFVSIVLGIVDHFYGSRFLEEASKRYSRANNDLPSLEDINDVRGLHVFRHESLKGLQDYRKIWPLYLQCSTLGTGFVLDFILLITLVF